MSKLKQNINSEPGFLGRPEDYPVPPESDKLLFYIQKNQNKNTVVYELNYNNMGELDKQFPMHAYWIRYTDGGELQELNPIQNKLAYGYEAKILNHESFEFNFVSYKKLKFFIAKPFGDRYNVICKINNKMSILHNVYVYAHEYGVFPIVKYIDLYGIELSTKLPNFQKIVVES